MDPMNGTQTMQVPWREKVDKILAGVRRESRIYFALGLCSYVLAGFAFIKAVKDPSLSALLIMGYFQLMVIFFGTMKIYPCIRGGFLVSVEQTCESVDDMRAIRHEIERQGAPIPSRGSRPVHETKDA